MFFFPKDDYCLHEIRFIAVRSIKQRVPTQITSDQKTRIDPTPPIISNYTNIPTQTIHSYIHLLAITTNSHVRN